MSSLVKEDLAKRLFGPRRQRLHEFIEVEGSGAWRCYLCAAVTKSKEVEICMVKHFRVDREEKYEVVEKWFLKDLEMIDGKEADTDNPYFDMHFHKVYSMEAYSCASKYTFARTLNKLNEMYLKKDLKIVNFDNTYLNDDSIWSSNNRDCLDQDLTKYYWMSYVNSSCWQLVTVTLWVQGILLWVEKLPSFIL